jgi:peptidoglycan/LPS O-acetylase OafA/YrhL
LFGAVAVCNLETSDVFREMIVGLSFVPVLIWLARLPFPNNRIFIWTGHRLAGMSYTLYANHYPLAGLLIAALVRHHMQTGVKQWIGFWGITALIILLNYGLYWCFERNTNHIRRFFVQKQKSQA